MSPNINLIVEKTYTEEEVIQKIYDAIYNHYGIIEIEEYPDGTVRSVEGVEKWFKLNKN